MKKTLFILGVTVVFLTSFTANVKESGKELCKSYFPLDKGAVLTYEMFDAKDKLEGTHIMTVKDVIETSESVKIDIHSKMMDKKGEDLLENDFSYMCEGGEFKMSMESMMDPQMMEAYKDMEVTMTQDDLSFPSNPTVGQELPDAKMQVTISSNGTTIMTMNFKITDRKIEAKESITTSAGTFECFKMSQNTNTKMMFMDQTTKSISWIAENIGTVRSESYNKKGKLESYQVLTSIKR